MRVFVDTAPFIYLIENHPKYADRVADIMATSLAEGHTFITSVITILEFGVKPEKENKHEVITRFEDLLNELETEVKEIDRGIAVEAYQLRAKYQFLKGLDTIQLATAITSSCDSFVTNDTKLEKVKEITVTLIDT
ncbi:type II toxin-antitoxin system VapC family toxin [Tunicatimonas pelagia]|uniref:type II toxin-antitoxin system VapC family toxin n=1 Tax=Tunicatimonas pelagia TaxID=931531 RepID=UPI002664E70E|nr:PIN domain-containing protein [Tunicatimonas pelagia]WKN41278.1 PIN domain-containing protein [Tunicatimonas pelagia]